MRSYTLHARPAPPPASAPAAGRGARPGSLPLLVPEGFSLTAALLPGPWLLAQGLWLPFVLVTALYVLALAWLPGSVLAVALPAAHLLLGLEARNLQRWVLARRGLLLAGVVLAKNREAALLRALDARPELAARGVA
jgi:hypothetical protein